MRKTLLALAGVGVIATGCTTTGHTEKTAAVGAGIGALAGAVIGNNVGGGSALGGAAIGGLVGGTIGAVKGCRDEGGCGAAPNRRQYYDERAGRYYYYDSATHRYYWENGEPR